MAEPANLNYTAADRPHSFIKLHEIFYLVSKEKNKKGVEVSIITTRRHRDGESRNSKATS